MQFNAMLRFLRSFAILPPQISDHVQRGNYAELNDKDVSHFEQLLGKNHVLTEDLEGYNICFLKRIRGKCALSPESNTERITHLCRPPTDRQQQAGS